MCYVLGAEASILKLKKNAANQKKWEMKGEEVERKERG